MDLDTAPARHFTYWLYQTPTQAPDRSRLEFRQLEKTSKADLEVASLRCSPIGSIASPAGPDLMQPPSKSAIEAGSNIRAASNWT
jgi:hypothetical protein